MIDIRQIQDLGVDTKKGFLILDKPYPNIHFAHQETGFGSKSFFICPTCGSRRVKLYVIKNNIYCRSCSPISPYKGIQNSTKGGERELAYRIKKIAKEYKINYRFPFSYWEYVFDRPKYMRVKKWQDGLRKMQIMENMRFQNILYKTTYEPKLINFIFENCLYRYSLKDIQEYVIDWKGEYIRTVEDINRANKGDKMAMDRLLKGMSE